MRCSVWYCLETMLGKCRWRRRLTEGWLPPLWRRLWMRRMCRLWTLSGPGCMWSRTLWTDRRMSGSDNCWMWCCVCRRGNRQTLRSMPAWWYWLSIQSGRLRSGLVRENCYLLLPEGWDPLQDMWCSGVWSWLRQSVATGQGQIWRKCLPEQAEMCRLENMSLLSCMCSVCVEWMVKACFQEQNM